MNSEGSTQSSPSLNGSYQRLVVVKMAPPPPKLLPPPPPPLSSVPVASSADSSSVDTINTPTHCSVAGAQSGIFEDQKITKYRNIDNENGKLWLNTKFW